MKKTLNEFISEANLAHSYIYNYEKSVYHNYNTKLIVNCQIHGDFSVSPNNHISKKSGCPYCVNKGKVSNETFIKRASKTHNYKYNYEQVNFEYVKDKVKIYCITCKSYFYQTVSEHLSGKGCKFCSGNQVSNTKCFIEKSKLLHNYDYSLVDYKNATTKVIIICNQHGEFLQTPNNHLNGKGCPSCRSSKGEIKIKNYLENNNIKYEYQYRIDNMIFDFKVGEIFIEFDGKQHFEYVEQFHKKEGFEKQLERDKKKDQYCLNNNIRLLRISYKDNLENKLNEYLK